MAWLPEKTIVNSWNEWDPLKHVIVGNEMLEATMSYRCRCFEYLCYRRLLQQYCNEDPNMRHESAPKPRLTDADYHKDYLSDKIGEQKRLEWTAQKFFVTREEEPLFDAADVLMLDEKTVCVEASEVYQMEQFDKLGLDVIPVSFRDAYPFGDALHCATADVYRKGICQDYFPKQ